MAERVLTRRELNRALLARQLLLERKPSQVSKVVEQLGGLQAQHSSSPYLSLHARVAGFERDDLTTALERRRVVKALLQRGTLHIVTPRDYWAFTAARRAFGADYWPPGYERLLPKSRIVEIARNTIAELRGGPRTFDEVRAILVPHETERISTTFLWRRVQGQEQVVHLLPSGTWGYHGEGVYSAADAVLRGSLPEPTAAREHLVRSYLRAFGPATARDVAQWAGLQRTGGVTETLASMVLRTFRDDRGKTLYDLPRAPLPDAETPYRRAWCRVTTTSSSRMRTAHASSVTCRSRASSRTTRSCTRRILVDGFVAGTWKLENGRVRLEPFSRLPRAAVKALRDEAERIEAFVAG